MFETSKDLLYIVIAFCILWITVFLCWVFYYVMRLLRNANQIAEEFRAKLQSLTDAVGYIRGKVEHISTALSLVTSGVGGLVKKVVARKAESWINQKTENLNSAAKEAVDRAVEATAKKMRKAVKRVRND